MRIWRRFRTFLSALRQLPRQVAELSAREAGNVAELSQRIAELNGENEKLQRRLQEHSTTFHHQLEALEHALAQSNADAARGAAHFDAALAQLGKRGDDLVAQCHDLVGCIDQIHREQDTSSAALQEQIATVVLKLDTRHTELIERQMKTDAVLQNVDARSQQLSELSDRHSRSLADLLQEWHQLSADVRHWNTRCDGLEQSQNELRQYASRLNEYAERLNTRCDSVKQSQNELQQHAFRLNEYAERLNTRCDSFEQSQNELRQYAFRLNDYALRLNTRCDNLHRYSDMIEENRALQQRYAAIRWEIVCNYWHAPHPDAVPQLQLSLEQLLDRHWARQQAHPFCPLPLTVPDGKKLLVVGNMELYPLDYTGPGLTLLFASQAALIVPQILSSTALLETADCLFVWGMVFNQECMCQLLAYSDRKPLYFLEDGFLRSIYPAAVDDHRNPAYSTSLSFTIDDLAFYFDATRPTRLESMLNDRTRTFSAAELERARRAIDFIVANRLSKYNHQPLTVPLVGTPGKRKILVVDQAYQDYSIRLGRATDETFAEMLQAAIRENPDADILVKTHPDMIGSEMRGKKAYFSHLQQEPPIYPITFNANPYALLEQVDEVYVCSSMLGLEALMANKKVHTFGMPFYAGWGCTADRQTVDRRCVKRSLEELFYIVYIDYSRYYDPENHCLCELERTLEYLLKLRTDFWHDHAEKDNKHE